MSRRSRIPRRPDGILRIPDAAVFGREETIAGSAIHLSARQEMRIRVIKAVTAILFTAGVLSAADKPDFSGQWNFNLAKSTLDEFGTQFLPSALSLVHAGNDFMIEKTYRNEFQGDFTSEERLTLDGKECKTEFWNSPRSSIATWSANGDTLIIVTTIELNMEGRPVEMLMREAMSLSKGGKVLSVRHYSKSSWGERKLIMVYEKQETPTNKTPTTKTP
jgi:hypothetical protein